MSEEVISGVLAIPSSHAICSGELNPRVIIMLPPSSAPHSDLSKVRGFVRFLPPNCPLGEKMRRKSRLITASFLIIMQGIRTPLQGCQPPAELPCRAQGQGKQAGPGPPKCLWTGEKAQSSCSGHPHTVHYQGKPRLASWGNALLCGRNSAAPLHPLLPSKC